MDTSLHCNDLKCRATLHNQAVVTTCSHIFCLPCADRLELTAPKDGQRKCPACFTYLLNTDDAVVTSLNPSEDYKTSILSGLSPTIIIECAGRGLQFWSYQMAQEITYQDYLARTLKDRYSVLGAQLDNVVREADEENNKLMARIDDLQAREQHLVNQIQVFEMKWKEKDKAFRQMDGMYRKAKAQLLNGGIEVAAEQDADQVLHAGTQYHSSQAQHPGIRPRRAGSHGSGDHGQGHSRPSNVGSQYLPQGISAQLGRATGSSHTISAQTPSGQHRQHFPLPTFGNYNASIRDPLRRDSIPQATPHQPRHNSGRGYDYHGIGANIRSSRPLVPASSHRGYGAVRGSQLRQ